MVRDESRLGKKAEFSTYRPDTTEACIWSEQAKKAILVEFNIIICSFVVEYDALLHSADLSIMTTGQMLQTLPLLHVRAHT